VKNLEFSAEYKQIVKWKNKKFLENIFQHYVSCFLGPHSQLKEIFSAFHFAQKFFLSQKSFTIG